MKFSNNYQSLETPGEVYTVILWVGYLNSALNPLLYVLLLRVDIKIVKLKFWSNIGLFQDAKKCLSKKYGLLMECCQSNSDTLHDDICAGNEEK